MKILVAIESSENPKKLARKVLPWASRAGYDMRIFIPHENQLDDYSMALLEANVDQYLDLQDSMLIPKDKPKEYAKANGYDLLLYLPDDLSRWNDTRIRDKMIIEYAADVGRTRVLFGDKPHKKIYSFPNGAVMYRV